MAREEAARRVAEAPGAADNPFLWLRQLVGEALARLHQERFGGDVRGDISLYRGALPEATSISLAAHLLGKPGGEDDRAAARAEHKLLLQETLNALDPIDREVLTLRHCEQLSNDETATVLGVSKSQASEAYIRALKRVTPVLTALKSFKGRPST
jgi:RNA polymerase sigma-70 factor (ECF subfamily)